MLLLVGFFLFLKTFRFAKFILVFQNKLMSLFHFTNSNIYNILSLW